MTLGKDTPHEITESYTAAPVAGMSDSDSVKISINSQEIMEPFQISAHTLSTLVDPKDIEKLVELGNVEGIAQALHVSLTNGLVTTEADSTIQKEHVTLAQRRLAYGSNVIPANPQTSIWELIWDARHDKILCMLVFAATVSLAVGLYEDFGTDTEQKIHWIEGASIFIAVFLVVTITAFNDYQKEKQFRKLNAKKEDRHIKVVRDGTEQQISIHDILVGDIVIVEPGDLVCADGLVLDSHLLACDESGATGESDTIKKGRLAPNYVSEHDIKASADLTSSSSAYNTSTEPRKSRPLDPFLLSGTKVVDGIGNSWQ